MEIALSQGSTVDFWGKLRNITSFCKISNIEKLLSDGLENMPSSSPVDYIGELNKNDVMH